MIVQISGSLSGQTYTITGASGPDGDLQQANYSFLRTGDASPAYGGSFQSNDLPLGVGPLAAGDWQLTVVDDADTSNRGTRSFTVAAAAVCDLVLSNVHADALTQAGQYVPAYFTVSSSHPPVQVDGYLASGGSALFGQNAPGDGQQQQFGLRLTPGAYYFLATDAAGCTQRQSFTIAEYAQPAVRGCTDPAATNYNPDATQDDGSCQYTPPVRVPYFEVPSGQGLRFVQPGRLDKPAFDNTLLADERPLDFTVDSYCQLAEQGDTLSVQALSNYQGAPILKFYQNDQALGPSYPLTRVQQGAGTTQAFEVYLKPDTVGGRTRVYFNDDSLPLPFLAGQRVTISGTTTSLDGTYPLHDVLEDATAAVPYLVITAAYPSGNIRLDGSLTTTYVVQAYDTYQVALALSAIPRGCYQARITADDSDFGQALAVSEPLDVESTHPGTLLIAYRNSDNAFGLNYSSGLVNRLRVKGRFFQRQTASQKTVLRNDDNRLVLLSADVQAKVQLEVLLLPGYLHQTLATAFAHDFVKVQNVPVVLEGDYTYEPVERYTLGRGTALLERVGAIGVGNGDDLGDVDQGGGPYLLINDSRLLINP